MTQQALSTNQYSKDRLIERLEAQSKHSTYQELHPSLVDVLGPENSPMGKREAKRWEYMANRMDFTNKCVLDIGANTGYFSIAAVAHGASMAHAYEGNKQHADFICESAKVLGMSDQLQVFDQYYNFVDTGATPSADVSLCLNVLHHLGDDFGDSGQPMEVAKLQMADKLRYLAQYSQTCWFQLGFNWKGDRSQPLFPNGLKSELISFVKKCCEGAWNLDDIGLYNPDKHCYESINGNLLQRFDNVGEFLNRPLFLLKSHKF